MYRCITIKRKTLNYSTLNKKLALHQNGGYGIKEKTFFKPTSQNSRNHKSVDKKSDKNVPDVRKRKDSKLKNYKNNHL